MGALLGVGQGSVRVLLWLLKWMGGGDEATIALVGKGLFGERYLAKADRGHGYEMEWAGQPV